MEKKAKIVMKSDVFKVKLKENKFAFSKKGELSEKEFSKKDNLLKKSIITTITNLVNEISSSKETVKKLSNNLKIKVNITEKDGVKTLASKESIVTLSLVNNKSCSKKLQIQRISNNAKVVGIEICEEVTSREWWISVKEVNSMRKAKELNELSTNRLLKILQTLEKNIK